MWFAGNRLNALKSTTIDCMIGAKKFDQGEIKINGHDIKDEAYAAKRHLVIHQVNQQRMK